ncbi:MAG: TSUP family transporter [Kastovskya adunca ATA6-11-RM4]|nr:TSUP family transporter [Kastovskya adunca ATA6-11-RM4]
MPIGLLGGLMGLGGAEFRLPVLVGSLRYSARQAIPLNLAVSLVTITVALATRIGTLSFQPVLTLLPAVFALIAGAVVTAFSGAVLGSRLSNERLEQIILVLLVNYSRNFGKTVNFDGKTQRVREEKWNSNTTVSTRLISLQIESLGATSLPS